MWCVLRIKVGFDSVFQGSERRQYDGVVNSQAVESVTLNLPLVSCHLARDTVE